MSNSESAAEYWTARVRDALSRHAEPLLREIIQRLLKPRNQWPIEELIDRSVAALTNAAVVDRRIKELAPASRKALALIGLSRQPLWRVGHLISVLATLDHAEGLRPILDLLESGLAQPDLPDSLKSIKQFEDWLGPSGIASARLFAHPIVTSRALQEEFGLPVFPTKAIDSKAIRQGDGLEWQLRIAVAWQRVSAEPLRLTQQQTLFKRDMQRFQTDEVLGSPFAEQMTDLPDVGLLALSLAVATGLIESDNGELRGLPAPALWDKKPLDVLLDLGYGLFKVEGWTPTEGYTGSEEGGLFTTIALPVLLILRSLPATEWIEPATIADYLFDRHPSWAATIKKNRETATKWIERFLLGVAYPIRLVETVQQPSGWWFRLGDVGRHWLCADKAPRFDNEFRQTLIVQPNGEIIAFRQGLTPDLVGKLSRFAVWKNLGAACTMELSAESVYHGLETGLTSAEIQRLLDQHGTHNIPATVVDSLQRWASKRERITIWSAATLMEFTNADDLEMAYQRGLISTCSLRNHCSVPINSASASTNSNNGPSTVPANR
ncbi:MAG: helicase-associated domain-containing protein [Planctomycetes bacterium]|nr:helicase-associated domain-containing protein [Planctomycetota bacterium]